MEIVGVSAIENDIPRARRRIVDSGAIVGRKSADATVESVDAAGVRPERIALQLASVSRTLVYTCNAD